MALIQCDFFAESLGFSASMNVILPQTTSRQIGMTGTERKNGTPVLYLLHGMSDDHTIWMRRTSIERYAADYGLAVVMPCAHRSFYKNINENLRYGDFIAEELPALVGKFFNGLSQKREDTFLAGLSMGGYGALRFALNFPERYAAAASLSGALDPNWLQQSSPAEFTYLYGSEEKLKNSENDLFYLAEKNRENPVKPKLFITCGTEDGFITVNRNYREHLRKNHFDVTYSETPGSHSWALWDQQIQAVLQWLPIGK